MTVTTRTLCLANIVIYVGFVIFLMTNSTLIVPLWPMLALLIIVVRHKCYGG